ncbi:unnamed protein product [Darwinula stevensoni]|uniref:START domain-containing protein n=1 Tax=Darwinula stevensoni TaxID=69355 RepID=A0A7R9A8R0_9CRUS|nr:unnamed protein product [Darwinula stevensoni]CAG0896695.1 unnamed protein product [Darwinula stevensoni]
MKIEFALPSRSQRKETRQPLAHRQNPAGQTGGIATASHHSIPSSSAEGSSRVESEARPSPSGDEARLDPRRLHGSLAADANATRFRLWPGDPCSVSTSIFGHVLGIPENGGSHVTMTPIPRDIISYSAREGNRDEGRRRAVSGAEVSSLRLPGMASPLKPATTEKFLEFWNGKAALDLECNRVARDMRDNTLEATADWHSDVKEYKVLQVRLRGVLGDIPKVVSEVSVNDPFRLPAQQRLTDACWVVYQVMDPSPVGVIASRDVVILSYSRKIGDTHFVTMNSILWSGVEPREEMVRAEMKEGSGMSFSPDPERNTTRTLLRWVFSLDYKVPIIPATILLKFHAEGCRQYILGLRKYLSAKHQLPLVVLQD